MDEEAHLKHKKYDIKFEKEVPINDMLTWFGKPLAHHHFLPNPIFIAFNIFELTVVELTCAVAPLHACPHQAACVGSSLGRGKTG